MRMRKVAWAVDYLPESASLIKDPAENRPNHKRKNRKLHVELGAGKGKYSLDMASMYPEEDFIAVEKNESAAGIAAKKYDEANLENLRLIHGDAADLASWFDRQKVDAIHLNFSDPWPKKRNAKRRLSSKSFLESYKEVLRPGGEVLLKTDNKDLFEYSVAEFSKNGFVIDELSVDYRRSTHVEDAITEYEQKFIDENKPIYRAVFINGAKENE